MNEDGNKSIEEKLSAWEQRLEKRKAEEAQEQERLQRAARRSEVRP